MVKEVNFMYILYNFKKGRKLVQIILKSLFCTVRGGWGQEGVIPGI